MDAHQSTEAPARPRACTSFKIRQLARSVSQHYDAEVAAAGIKASQYSLLAHVHRLGPVRPVDLANAMRMDASTLTRTLRPLVDAGWVAVASGADARSRLARLTPSGTAKLEEAHACWKRAQRGLQDRLGVARVAALHALIDESLGLLGASDAPPSGSPGSSEGPAQPDAGAEAR
ncbi:MAG: MarR family winged helix-turn-helix transcriptional regulator [Xylophilus ampelinus]